MLRVVIQSALENPSHYKGRYFWENLFRERRLWPELLAYDATSLLYSSEIDHYFLELQLMAITDEPEKKVVGIAHAVSLHFDGPVDTLPDTGWDWALTTAVSNYENRQQPNLICGLSITVLPEAQQMGVGSKLIQGVVSLAARQNIREVVMPVRPIRKHIWPRLPMAEFITKHRADGFHPDPWIRTHQRAGATMLKPCDRSMTIVQPIEKWERWADRKFTSSGDFLVDSCLAPVQIDLHSKFGIYTEPNVWMHYNVP